MVHTRLHPHTVFTRRTNALSSIRHNCTVNYFHLIFKQLNVCCTFLWSFCPNHFKVLTNNWPDTQVPRADTRVLLQGHEFVNGFKYVSDQYNDIKCSDIHFLLTYPTCFGPQLRPSSRDITEILKVKLIKLRKSSHFLQYYPNPNSLCLHLGIKIY